MSSCQRERWDPVRYCRENGVEPTNITYDPKLRKGDYSIIRQQSHDGTHIFFHDMMRTIVNLLLKRESYYAKNPPHEGLRDIRYTVGPIRCAIVYGRVTVGCGEISGQRERYRMPVKVEYVYQEQP